LCKDSHFYAIKTNLVTVIKLTSAVEDMEFAYLANANWSQTNFAPNWHFQIDALNSIGEQ